MNFYLVDDDITTRSMLTEIIEDNDLGQVVKTSEDGTLINESLFSLNKIDILLIDLLMPNKDGIETIKDIKPFFDGKIIMISQVESKELISLAYSSGIEYYVTKPINKIEILSVIRKVRERFIMEKSMSRIQKTMFNMSKLTQHQQVEQKTTDQRFINSVFYLLSEIGIIGENGHQDIVEIAEYLFAYEQTDTFKEGFPNLKDILYSICKAKLGYSPDIENDINREVKASEQRIRRAVVQSLDHLASLGLIDFANLTFETYAHKFFNFTLVRQRMNELKHDIPLQSTEVQVNAKKFIQSLFYEAKRLIMDDL